MAALELYVYSIKCEPNLEVYCFLKIFPQMKNNI